MKKELAEKSYGELQESITIKKSKLFDKSVDKINETSETMLFDESHLLREIDLINKERISISRLIQKADKLEPKNLKSSMR